MIRPRKLYSLYGLRLRSNAPLPCPECADPDDGPAIDLIETNAESFERAANGKSVRHDADEFWECDEFADGSTRVTWREHFEFLISGDRSRILWHPLASVPREVLFTYLLNQVLAYVLVARGIEPLHATAVAVDGMAVALLGPSGRGKSTLAAAMISLGHRLLTDDVLVIEFRASGCMALPSLPRLKLFPEPRDALLGSSSSLPMNSYTRKSILTLGTRQAVDQAVPLRAAYVLTPPSGDQRIRIQRTRGPVAVLAAIEHSFHDSLQGPGRMVQQFAFAAQLANMVPIKDLDYPRDLAQARRVARAVLDDLSIAASAT